MLDNKRASPGSAQNSSGSPNWELLSLRRARFACKVLLSLLFIVPQTIYFSRFQVAHEQIFYFSFFIFSPPTPHIHRWDTRFQVGPAFSLRPLPKRFEWKGNLRFCMIQSFAERFFWNADRIFWFSQALGLKTLDLFTRKQRAAKREVFSNFKLSLPLSLSAPARFTQKILSLNPDRFQISARWCTWQA